MSQAMAARVAAYSRQIETLEAKLKAGEVDQGQTKATIKAIGVKRQTILDDASYQAWVEEQLAGPGAVAAGQLTDAERKMLVVAALKGLNGQLFQCEVNQVVNAGNDEELVRLKAQAELLGKAIKATEAQYASLLS